MKCVESLQATIKSTRHAGELAAKAIHAYSGQCSGKEDDPAVLLAAGKLAMTTPDRLAEACQLLGAALARDPELHEARAFLALAELQSGSAEAGLETAVGLAFRAPDFTFKTRLGLPTSAQTVLGDALFQNNRIDEAIAAYERAIRVQAHDQHAVRRLASLYLAKGQASNASGLLNRIEVTDETRTLVSAVRLAANDASRLPSISGIASTIYCVPVV